MEGAAVSHCDQSRVLARSHGQRAESRRAYAAGGRGPGLRGAMPGAYGTGPAGTADRQAGDPGVIAEVPQGVPAQPHPLQDLSRDRGTLRHLCKDGGKVHLAGPGGPAARTGGEAMRDRKSVVSGTRVSVRVGLGGRRIIKKKKNLNETKEVH